MSVTVRLQTIGPELAYKLLESNKNNRPIDQNTVKRYAQDMRTGSWGISESAIAISIDGSLLNGQHRLWAVVESKTTIQAFLASGYPPESILYMDDSLPRKESVQYNLSHEDKASTLAVAIGRLLLNGPGIKTKPSRSALFGMIDKHRQAIAFAEHTLPSKKILGASAVVAVIARAYYSVPHHTIVAFCDVIKTGRITAEIDKVPSLLREFLYRGVYRSSDLRTEKYWKTEKALQYYAQGRVVQKLYAEAGHELFPLPEEKVKATTSSPSSRPSAGSSFMAAR